MNPSVNDLHWNWGLYFNKTDQRLFIPKQNPWLGWTINFGHPYGPPVFVGMVVGGIMLGSYCKTGNVLSWKK